MENIPEELQLYQVSVVSPCHTVSIIFQFCIIDPKILVQCRIKQALIL